ncbi:MAG: GNAT family N-acetyltransferase [Betaproteobacteria bacterium]|nr:GNAT family N-acetyltransferase [Betaproteobacteria bacterium]
MPALAIRPLTPERWPDLEAVFMARGCSVARGCWCMFYRETGSFILPGGKQPVLARKQSLHDLVAQGPPPGLIAYRGGKPVGWVTLGPREDFKRLARSRAMKAVDEKPVWSIVCFVVPSEFRGQGVATALLEGAVAWAKKQGAAIIEAYPKEPEGKVADDSLWFGRKSMYDKAGFTEVARHTPGRPVMRKALRKAAAPRKPAARRSP